jgi:ADP-heptose:LPS heptosyltransferase
MMPRSGVEKILVIKHGALGDIIQGIDAYAAIRAGHPRARISLLTTSSFAGITRAMPFFDEVLIDPRAKAWNILSLLKIRSTLRSGWTRIYDFQSSRRTERYFKSLVPSGVEFVGVHDGVSHRIPDMTGVNNRDRMLKTAQIGGCPEVDAPTDWLLEDPPEGTPDGGYAVLIPGCSPAKPAKRWPARGYAKLAEMLLNQRIAPVLAGTNIDRGAGDDLLASTVQSEGIVDLIGRTSLTELAGLLGSAHVVIGNDTGPVFLSARLGTPTMMVMSSHTDPSMSAPYGPKAAWIRRDNLADLSAEDVMAGLGEIIR